MLVQQIGKFTFTDARKNLTMYMAQSRYKIQDGHIVLDGQQTRALVEELILRLTSLFGGGQSHLIHARIRFTILLK